MPRRLPDRPIHPGGALLDVVKGELIEPGDLLIEGERIAEVDPSSVPAEAGVIDLGDLTLLPGLMDMEVNLLLGGPTSDPAQPGAGRPAVAPCGRWPTPAGRLGPGSPPCATSDCSCRPGLLLDVALAGHRPRLDRRPAGGACGPCHLAHRGHLDPTMFQALAPHHAADREEGIADGVSEVRKAVRYQIKHGAKLIKSCASGGVMSRPAWPGRSSTPTRSCGSSSTRPTGRPQGGGPRPRRRRHQGRHRGRHRLHRARLAGSSEDTLRLMVEHGTFLVATTYLADGMDVLRPPRSCRPRRPRCSAGGQGHHQPGHRAGREGGLRHRRPGHPHGRNA